MLAIPAVYAGHAYISAQNAQIAFSAKERVGVRYVQPVTALLAKLVDARHDAVAAAVAGTPPQPPDIQRELSAVAAVDRDLGAELQTTKLWNELRPDLDALTSQPQSDAQAAFDAYSEATAGAQALIVQAGDKSNLILDPDLDSFYVMDAIITKLPQISDTLGRAGDRLVLHDGGVEVEERITLAVDNGMVTTAVAAATAGLATTFKSTNDQQLAPRLQAPLQDMAAQIDGATKHVDAVVRSEPDRRVDGHRRGGRRRG